MTSPAPPHLAPYTVRLVDCPGLSDEPRAAAELRFRMALEFALGGPTLVLPSLQACMLARTLGESLAPDAEDEDDQADVEEDDELDADDQLGAAQMIALWEKAEAAAIQAALKPLGPAMAEARFEIVPR